MSLANLSNAQLLIKDWTDCWFGPTKRTGYISVTDLNRQKFYGANDINALLSDTEGIEKRFISLNAFTFGSRETSNLKQIRNIGIDLDQYKLGLSIDDVIDEIHSLILDDIIPEPNLILSSRGVQLFYAIKDGAAPNMGYLVSYITDQFIGKLKHIGADSNAKDLSRVMRAPNSINERNGAIVEPSIWNDKEYTLQELLSYCKPMEQFETRKKKKAKIIRFSPRNQESLSLFYQTNFVRLQDLEKLISIRKGDFSYKRNTFLYIYAYHQSLHCNTFTNLEYFAREVFTRIHSTSGKAMRKAEFTRTIKSAYNDAREFFDYYKANGYKIIYKANDGIIKPYRTSNLIDKLEITEDEQRQLKRLVGPKVAKEKDAERKRKERRAAGVKSREEYLKQHITTKQEGIRLKEQGYKYKEIAEKLDVNINTVKGWFRKV